MGLWYVAHGISFNQVKPLFFNAGPDITGHLIFGTGLQHSLLQHGWLRLVMDLLFFLLSPFLVYCFIKRKRGVAFLACFSIIFNILYIYLLSAMSFVSKEPFIAWMLMPVLFTKNNTTSFYFKLNALRILFILFFASAGIWKLRGGGAFDMETMSGILVRQHSIALAAGAHNFLLFIVRFLIEHPAISFIIYWLVILAEIFFFIGLFTKRFDRLLIIILVLFICFDYVLMQINYFSWLPFALLFYYSRYGLAAYQAKQS